MVKADHLRRQLTKIRKLNFDKRMSTSVSSSGSGRGKSQGHAAGSGREGVQEGAGVRKMKPAVMAVERWLMHYALKCRTRPSAPPSARPLRDAVFPMYANAVSYVARDDLCELLVQDLMDAQDPEEDARTAAEELLHLSHQLALEVWAERAQEANGTAAGAAGTAASAAHKGGSAGWVQLLAHKHTCDVIYHPAHGRTNTARQLLKLNPAHLEKLRLLHNMYASRTSTPEDAAAAADAAQDALQDAAAEQLFLSRVFCLLARYQTVQGHGFQAAVAESAFRVLHTDMAVTLECFASPLNCAYGRHCSAFPDTDKHFGSLGSFFDFAPTSGSFEVNPPFVLALMAAMNQHICALFAAAEGPLSFVVVVPVWEGEPFFVALIQHPHLVHRILIAKKDHGFCDGASHQRQDRYRDSPYDTEVFILQNDRGAARYPCTRQTEESIRQGFAAGIPTDAMRLRQGREGRGTADEARGVYKGKNANRTGEGVVKRKREEFTEQRAAKKKEIRARKALQKEKKRRKLEEMQA